MSTPEQEPHAADESGPLELNKETLQDLDLEAADADGVKGGTAYYLPTGRLTSVAISGSRVSGSVPPPIIPSGYSTSY